jgi:ADP-ribose pyrophosphatase
MSRVTVTDRRLAAANSKWKVYLEAVGDARGNAVPDYLVIEGLHPRADQVTGVAVLPVVADGFVLVRCYRHALRREMWEVPRGFLDAGETFAAAALRELAEETGLTCAPEDLLPLGHYAPEPSTFAARGALFAARRCVGAPRPAADEMGLEETCVIARARMAEMVANGEIEEAGTLIAYYRYCAAVSHGAG